MSTLITIADLKSHIGDANLLRLAGVGGFREDNGRSLDEPKINMAIAFASELITGYFVKRYVGFKDLETSSIPDVVKSYAADITHYQLRLKSGDHNDVTKEVRTRRDDALAWLKDVARGTVNIDFEDALPPSQGLSSPEGKVSSSSPAARAPKTLAGYGS